MDVIVGTVLSDVLDLGNSRRCAARDLCSQIRTDVAHPSLGGRLGRRFSYGLMMSRVLHAGQSTSASLILRMRTRRLRVLMLTVFVLMRLATAFFCALRVRSQVLHKQAGNVEPGSSEI